MPGVGGRPGLLRQSRLSDPPTHSELRSSGGQALGLWSTLPRQETREATVRLGATKSFQGQRSRERARDKGQPDEASNCNPGHEELITQMCHYSQSERRSAAL